MFPLLKDRGRGGGSKIDQCGMISNMNEVIKNILLASDLSFE